MLIQFISQFKGLYNETKKLVEEVSQKGVFARELQSSDIPYHSEYLITSAPKLTEELKKIVPNPKLRSTKWISTAILESECEEVLKYASAEYFVHNLISPVFFYNKLKSLPSDALVIEVGPHGLFSKVVTETLESGHYVSVLKKDSNDTNLDIFLTAVAKLYEFGLNPIIEKLYPKVEWPVPRGTQSLSSLIRWDHNKVLSVRKYPEHHFRPTASDLNYTYNPNQNIKAFFPEHCIDGNVLYPATGYLMLVWRKIAAYYGKLWNQLPVIFEDVQFRRPIFLSETDITRIKAKYFDTTGECSLSSETKNICLTEEFLLFIIKVSSQFWKRAIFVVWVKCEPLMNMR